MHTYRLIVRYYDTRYLRTNDHRRIAAAAVAATEAARRHCVAGHCRSARWAARWRGRGRPIARYRRN